MKEKTSITLSGDVLAAIERMAGSQQSWSAFIEQVLREFLRQRTRAAIQARDLERINAAGQRLNAGRPMSWIIKPGNIRHRKKSGVGRS